jgi:hypothetical protein
MQTLQQTAVAGTKAVKRLRRRELNAGRTFMINLKTLPAGQFYVEHPSGIIQLAVISGSKRDYEILRQLDEKETDGLRAQYDLY